MERLTEKQYWEQRIDPTTGGGPLPPPTSLKARLVRRYFSAIDRGYPRYLIYDVQCRKYFQDGALDVMEIGSAPGGELLTVHRKFGYEPYGVEYTANGVEANRELFREHGLNPDHVIQADFFDPEFQQAYRERFDVVMSHGFIEHFTEMEQVISGHVNLVKPGGLLLVTLPNLRWFNYLVASFFSRPALKTHNLSVMSKKNLRNHFRRDDLEILECKYIGTFNFGFIYGRNKSKPKLLIMDLLMKIQRLIDMSLYTFFRKGFIESPFCSPKLLVICRKRSGGGAGSTS